MDSEEKQILDELRALLDELRGVVTIQGKQLTTMADVLVATRAQVEQLQTVVDSHHQFLEKLFAQTEPPSIEPVN